MAEYDLIERNKIFEKVTELYRYSKGDMHIAYRELLDYILDMPSADVQPVKWISVKDRLPDENQKCLVYRDINADLKITTGIWHSDRKEFYGLRHGTRLEDTIAWMPLPELPKDGDAE